MTRDMAPWERDGSVEGRMDGVVHMTGLSIPKRGQTQKETIRREVLWETCWVPAGGLAA